MKDGYVFGAPQRFNTKHETHAHTFNWPRYQISSLWYMLLAHCRSLNEFQKLCLHSITFSHFRLFYVECIVRNLIKLHWNSIFSCLSSSRTRVSIYKIEKRKESEWKKWTWLKKLHQHQGENKKFFWISSLI